MANVVLAKVLKITRRLNLVVSRLGLEPRALALKAPQMMKKINMMNLLNRPMSEHAFTMSYSLHVLYRTDTSALNCYHPSSDHEFGTDSRHLLENLRTDEGSSLTAAELHVLKVQLYLLDHEVTRMEKQPRPKKTSAHL